MHWQLQITIANVWRLTYSATYESIFSRLRMYCIMWAPVDRGRSGAEQAPTIVHDFLNATWYNVYTRTYCKCVPSACPWLYVELKLLLFVQLHLHRYVLHIEFSVATMRTSTFYSGTFRSHSRLTAQWSSWNSWNAYNDVRSTNYSTSNY